jgi:hypothetical protein
LCFVCSTTKKIKDEDFSEFDDIDQDDLETPLSSNKPESINNQDLSQPESSKTIDEEVLIDDDDDDESMFDEEEFEAVIFIILNILKFP